MSSKKTKYIVFTDPDDGHTGQQADYITPQKAKKLLKDESVLVYIFKLPGLKYNPWLLKYPLCEYYSPLEINILNEDVWCSFNVESLKKKKKIFQNI